MPQEAHVYSYSAVLMGSPILLKLFQHNEHLAHQVFRLIKHYENLLTVNRSPSEVMNINHAAGLHPVVVNPAVYQLIKCAKSASLLPNSAFNLAIGPLVKCWKIGFQGSSVPPADEISTRLALTSPHQVILDDEQHSVFLTQAGMELDLGAIAKGYIADRVRDFLHSQQVFQGLINLGGNVQTLGGASQMRGTPWSVGLKKPFAGPDDLIGVIEVEGKSVVTSGTYERWFEFAGKRYHHILDPSTGYPLDNELHSVTIVSEDSVDGDIWTTLIYGMGVEQGCACLANKPGIEAIFVTKDRRVVLSSQQLFTFTLQDSSYQLAPQGS
ncbi:thiamine biosynthesis protein ApbE [Mangrovibacter phragmitis]|uniref:FAD:protein FMN transferase n=1 Tax=Mangrovibacter phragmitis TaxID=1691903 RepID=A0A1B7L0I4_9ENTR|nr:FAD:protein FMN transferase [Mangrovibacter phragmitis]OAT75912.1 thiamine biosynthesis protein ApbE [Mangrovibacter phragmitis]